jgi:hypothetical protein
MSIQDDIAADLAAVQAAQTALDAANQKLADDRQTALTVAAPHLALWDEVVTAANALGTDVAAPFVALAERAKTLLGL